MKIYLSLSEAERLIFQKMLVVELNRLKNIKRRQAEFSVIVTLSEETLVMNNEWVFILASSVNSYDVVEKDLSIFVNQCKLPRGMLTCSDASVRDMDAEEILKKHADDSVRDFGFDIDQYTFIRRALVGMFSESLDDENITHGLIVSQINNCQIITEFEKKLLKAVLDERGYPRLEAKVNGYKADEFFNWVWLGKFVKDYLEQEGSSSDDVDLVRGWMRQLSTEDFNIRALDGLLQNAPVSIHHIQASVIGYYIAFVKINESVLTLLKNLETLKKDTELCNAIYYWFRFFVCIFKEELDYIYPVEEIRSDFLILELIAVQLSKQVSLADASLETFDISEVDRHHFQDLVKSHFILRNGELTRKNRNADVVLFENLLEKYKAVYDKSPLYNENRNYVGLAVESQNQLVKGIDNNFILNRNGFILNQAGMDDVVYYGDVVIDNLPRYLNIKPKKYVSLVPKEKKVLLGFIKENDLPGLIDLYSRVTPEHNGLKRAVFVWLVNREAPELQSSKFNSERKSLEQVHATQLDIPVTVLVKNINNSSDKEIIRLLAQSLTDVQLKDIEVIDENFDGDKAELLAEATKQLIVQKESVNYYTLNTYYE